MNKRAPICIRRAVVVIADVVVVRGTLLVPLVFIKLSENICSACQKKKILENEGEKV